MSKERRGDPAEAMLAQGGGETIGGHLLPDYARMLVSMPPKMSVSSFMGYLKGKSSLMMFEKHGNLKYKFGNRKFWMRWLLRIDRRAQRGDHREAHPRAGGP